MKADLTNIHPLFSIDFVVHESDQEMTGYHYHNGYELYILEQGYQNLLVHDILLDVAKYDVVLYKPNTFHKSMKRQGCARTCIYFSERFLQLYFTEHAIKTLLHCFEKELISLNKEIFPKIKKLMLLLEKESVHEPDNRIFIYLADILNILNDNEDAPRSEPFPSAISNLSPILSYINQNYSSITTIDEISDAFFISKFHLCHAFKKATGITLIQYLNKIRIQNACNMLAGTKLSVSKISAACGFHSSMYFCKVFKEALYVTPSEFRRNSLS